MSCSAIFSIEWLFQGALNNHAILHFVRTEQLVKSRLSSVRLCVGVDLVEFGRCAWVWVFDIWGAKVQDNAFLAIIEKQSDIAIR